MSCLKENSCAVLVQEMVYCVKSLYKLVVYSNECFKSFKKKYYLNHVIVSNPVYG